MGHLVGTPEVLWDDRTMGTAGVWSARTLVVVRTLMSQINDNGCLREVIIKSLMDRCKWSEMATDLYALPPRGIMGMAPLGGVHSPDSSERRPVQPCGTVGSCRWRWNSPSTQRPGG